MNINKIKDYWNKSSIWKQGFILGLFIFSSILIYTIILYKQSSSDMGGLIIFIPFVFFKYLFQKYMDLNLPILASILLTLVVYYFIGLFLALLIKKLGDVR